MVWVCFIFTFIVFADRIFASDPHHGGSFGDLKNFKNAVIVDAGSTGIRVYVYEISVEFDFKYSSVSTN